MESSNIPDYKLDHGFLKEWAFEVLELDEGLKECGMGGVKNSIEVTSQLPVYVQVTMMHRGDEEWNVYSVTDGEFHLNGCVFISKQTMPEPFSILKITKISKIPLEDMRSQLSMGRGVYLGKIDFDVEFSGENIGYPLSMEKKYIDIKDMFEIKNRKGLCGLVDLAESFEESPNDRLARYLWENRSEKFCDVKFTFENEKGVIVYAHKSALMSSTDVFKALFESEGFIDNESVNLVDTNSYTFNKFLEFVYTSNVQFTSWKLAFGLLYLSKKYLTHKLEKLCQDVITVYCDFSGENLLKVFNENHKVNDELIKKYIEQHSICRFSQISDVISSVDFLNCDFSMIQWILEMDNLCINEWALLCAVYKWACHNGSHAFCHKTEDVTDQNMECLHELLEYIYFERIDMISLKRFFKFPKLAEMVNVSELREHIFDGLLEDPSYFEQYGMATNGYSKNRCGFYNSVRAEIPIGNLRESQITTLKDIRTNDGPVLGFVVKVEPNNGANEEYSLDLSFSFQYLHSLASQDDGNIRITIRALPSHSRVKERVQVTWDEMELRKEESHDVKLHLKDFRGYLSDKIEDFGIETVDESKKDKVLFVKISIRLF